MPRRNYDNMQVQFYQDEEGEKINIKGAEVLFGSFRNFAGNATRFTKEGERFFNIAVPFNRIQQFTDQGINVKFWRASTDDDTEDGDEMPGFVRVKVNYDFFRKPQIAVREGANGQWVDMQESAIGLLDKAEFDDVGLILKIARGVAPGNRPYTSLYLRNGFFTKHVNEPNAYEADMFGEYGYNPNPVMPAPTGQEEELPFA